MHIILLLFMCLTTSSQAGIVTFLPDRSFDLPINFDDGKLPCSKRIVIFGDQIQEYVTIQSNTFVKELVLPKSGNILLFDGGLIFGAGPDTLESNCTEGKSYYLEKVETSWADAGVWSSNDFNEATPDAERVPCYDDIAIFPQRSEFTVRLPDLQQHLIGFQVGGMSLTPREFRYDILETEFNKVTRNQFHVSQQFILNSFGTVGINVTRQPCKSKAGCPCQEHPLEIDCSPKFCPTPTCVDPIKPIGHCCKICGGYVVIDIDESSFHLMMFKEFVEKTVKSYGNDLIYHVGRLLGNKVQVVIIEKNKYTGISAEVANEISHSVDRQWIHSTLPVTSGIPLYKTGISGRIAFGMLFVVVLTMGGIYVYYYRLPDIRYPIWGQSNSRSVFSRFQRRTDSVVSLTRRDSGVPIASGSGTAFRNPLYDSKRERVQVTETVVED